MSLFSVQHSSQGFNRCLDDKCCLSSTRVSQPCKSILLERCKRGESCNDTQQQPETCDRRCRSTLTAIVNGERVLRPWASDQCDPCRPPTPPPCAGDEACCKKRSKIISSRATDCGSVIVSTIVYGGPDQRLVMFVDLPQCDPLQQTEVAFVARSISVGEGKCLKRCQVACEFASLCVNQKKSTPSGVFIDLQFNSTYAPAALFNREGPCECFAPFCFEFEVWRRCAQPCCTDVETILPERAPSRCPMCTQEDCGCSDC